MGRAARADTLKITRLRHPKFQRRVSPFVVRWTCPLPKQTPKINARAPAWPPGRQGAPHLARGAALAEVWAARNRGLLEFQRANEERTRWVRFESLISKDSGAVEELLPPRAADSRHTLRALVPLAHLLGYASSVRSLTHGEASLSMEFSHYAPLDAHTEQQRLLELRGW